MRKKVSRRTKRVAASVSSSAKGQIRSKSATIHDLYSTRYRSLRQMKQVETSETERKQLSRAAKAALTQIERTLERKGTRIPTLKQHEQAVTARSEYAPGLLVVRCKQDVITAVPDLQTATIASVRALTLPTATEGPFKDLERKQLIKEVVPVFSRLTRGRSFAIAPTSVAASFATSVQDSENEDLRGINVLRLSKATDLREVEKSLENTPGIEYVHRVPRRWMTASGVPTPHQLPNDPMIEQQWNLRAIRWVHTSPLPDARTVKVAVLDTGVDITHPDLENILQTYIHEGTSALDIVGHGTHVCGILSAEMNNRVGIAGVCQCDLSVWKIFDDTPDPADGEYYVDEVNYQRALNAVRNSGMRVVSLSIGGTERSQTEEILFRRLINAGVTVVAAMGNEFNEGNPIEYPGAYSGIIAVGATGNSNRRAGFSNTGSHIKVCAPGVNILSTLPMTPSAARDQTQTKYAKWSGTSMATPHVSAVAALILAANPGLSPQQVADKLVSTASKVPAMKGQNITPEYGHGLLNVESAVS
jgi:hypothetical protein